MTDSEQNVVLARERLALDCPRVRVTEMLFGVSQWAWLAGAHCWIPSSGCNTASLVSPASTNPFQFTVTMEMRSPPETPQPTEKDERLVASIWTCTHTSGLAEERRQEGQWLCVHTVHPLALHFSGLSIHLQRHRESVKLRTGPGSASGP